MIERWKIAPHSSELHPGRYRVYVKCSSADIKRVIAAFGANAGQPWKIKGEEFNFSFYLNSIPDEEAELIEKKLANASKMIARGVSESEPAAAEQHSPPAALAPGITGVSEKAKPEKNKKKPESGQAPAAGDADNFILNAGAILGPELKETGTPREEMREEKKEKAAPPVVEKKAEEAVHEPEPPAAKKPLPEEKKSAPVTFDVFEANKIDGLKKSR